MSDPLETLLRSAPLNDRQRAGLWDMYESSKNADDLAARLKAMDLPAEVKAQLWDLKSQAAPTEPPPSGGASGSWKPPTWSDSLGLNKPTDSMLEGFARGSGAAAVDMAQGATAAVRNAKAAFADTSGHRQLVGAPPVPQQAAMEAPDTFAGKVGGVLPAAAEMAIPVGSAAKIAGKMLPSAARAGEKFQDVMGAARNVTVDVTAPGEVALRIQQLAERGGSMPLAVRKLLNRVTDPNKAPMAYEEARDFASNISRLSANEYGRLTPAVAREVANLRVALNQANAQAAKAAGKGAEYKSAMREYAQAMRLKTAIDTTVKKVLPIMTAGAAAGAAGNWMTRQIRAAIGGE